MRTALRYLISTASLGLIVGTASAADDLPTQLTEILDKACAHCHQVDKLAKGKDRPSGDFGYILDLKKMAKSEYVKKGNPASSKLYQVLDTNDMPKDKEVDYVTGECNKGCLSDDQKKVVWKWIEGIGGAPVVAAAEPPAGPADGPTEEGGTEETIAEGGGPDGPDAEETIAEGEPEGPDAGPKAPVEAAAAPPREFIPDEAVLAAIQNDLMQQSDTDRPRIRYFTLTNLVNAGDDEEDIEIYRQAFAKFINHLSSKPGIVKPWPVDEAKTVFRINIYDLGWTEKTWKMIEYANPYFVQFDSPMMDALQTETGTQVPFVRADWFTFVASQPPLYYDILGLPETQQELEAQLGLDAAADRTKLDVARAGFQESGVSQANRMIERHTIATGAYWESFDFGGGVEKQSFFQFPLGPNKDFGEFSEKYGFKHDGGEIIFNLPNGLQAYYLTTAEGKRLDKGPVNIVQDPESRDKSVTNGISCMSCHDEGMKDPKPEQNDQVRDFVLSTRSFPVEVRKIVEEIFPPYDEFKALLDEDKQRFLAATAKAGVKSNGSAYGEITMAFFKRFERELTAADAAAEMGMTPEQWEEAMNQGRPEDYALKKRFKFSNVPRDEWVALYPGIVNQVTDNQAFSIRDLQSKAKAADVVIDPKVYKQTTDTPQTSKKFSLAFYPNEDVYQVGYPVTFTIKPELDCALTLINIDAKGETVVLYPNAYNQGVPLKAGTTYTIPSKEIGGFKILFGDPGKETVIAKCNATDGGEGARISDYDKEAFTSFGDFQTYSSRALGDRKMVIVADPAAPGAVADYKPESAPPPEAPKYPPKSKPVAIKPAANPYDPDVPIIGQVGIVLEVKP